MSQQSYLAQDIALILHETKEEPAIFAALGDTRDLLRHTYYSVSFDLAWQILGHAGGIAALLEHELTTPLYPVTRALFEALVSQQYLRRTLDRDTEACAYQAYTFLKDQEDHPNDRALIEERVDLLARMPSSAVTSARERSTTRPWTWSGKSTPAMAEAAGLTNFRLLWSVLSGTSHAGRVGKNVRFGVIEGATQNVHIGEELGEEERQAFANFARRALKASFRGVWEDFDASPLRLLTPDPDSWRHAA